MRQFSIEEIAAITGGRLLSEDVDRQARITGIAIDSRKVTPGSLFVTIVGEKNDAHRFLPSVFEAGALAALVSKSDLEMASGKAYILVEDTVKAAQDLAKYYRSELKLPFIGITGSVGKTTTREMVATALSAKKRVFKTKANLNSQIGVPLTILEIDPSDEIAVIELGISEFGEMSKISNVVQPNVAVVTNIGTAHIENLGTREHIRDEKFHIQDAMPKGSFLFLNAEDDILAKSNAYDAITKRTFGGTDSDAFATDVKLIQGCPEFRANVLGEMVDVRLNVHGRHQILNALVALLVAKMYDVDLQSASSALSEFRGFSHRQQIFEQNGYVVIDDTYNASLASMKAAIDILSAMEVQNRVAILADMKELGVDEVKYHREIGEYLAEAGNVSELWCYGELAKEMAEAFANQKEDAVIRSFESLEELKDYVTKHLVKGVAYLLKGSNSMRLMEIADAIVENA